MNLLTNYFNTAFQPLFSFLFVVTCIITAVVFLILLILLLVQVLLDKVASADTYYNYRKATQKPINVLLICFGVSVVALIIFGISSGV